MSLRISIVVFLDSSFYCNTLGGYTTTGLQAGYQISETVVDRTA